MKLCELTIQDFIRGVGSPVPTPAGGSVAALCGSLGTALTRMVASLTLSHEKYKEHHELMRDVKKGIKELTEQFMELIQEDSEAYEQVITAYKLPKGTCEEKSARKTAVEIAFKQAATVPMKTLRASEALIRLTGETLDKGNPHTMTDAATALYLAYAAASASVYNIKINLLNIEDDIFVSAYQMEAEKTAKHIEKTFHDVKCRFEKRLSTEIKLKSLERDCD